MKVFVSWSGDYSKQLGAAIRWWLPKVLNPVEVYFSDTDIEAGARWYHEIVDALETSDAGLVILTPENITRQWLMFEAGALARSVTKARVCPILFGITKSEFTLNGGPLSFFQAMEFIEDDFRKLQRTINGGRLVETDLVEMFDNWWPQLQQKIGTISATPQPALKQPTEKELLQEILGLTRTLARELQALPPWQSFTLPTYNPQVHSMVEALRRKPLPSEATYGVLGVDDGLTAKSE